VNQRGSKDQEGEQRNLFQESVLRASEQDFRC
jgi:hypothetical protein